MMNSVAVASLLVAAVYGHGNITSPPARQVGPAMAALCGATAVAAVDSDPTNPIEKLLPVGAGCEYIGQSPFANAKLTRIQATPSCAVAHNLRTMHRTCNSSQQAKSWR